jgi:hypothetical protein
MTTETPFYAKQRALRELSEKHEEAAPAKLSAKSLARRSAEAAAKVSKKKVSKKTSSESD